MIKRFYDLDHDKMFSNSLPGKVTLQRAESVPSRTLILIRQVLFHCTITSPEMDLRLIDRVSTKDRSADELTTILPFRTHNESLERHHRRNSGKPSNHEGAESFGAEDLIAQNKGRTPLHKDHWAPAYLGSHRLLTIVLSRRSHQDLPSAGGIDALGASHCWLIYDISSFGVGGCVLLLCLT